MPENKSNNIRIVAREKNGVVSVKAIVRHPNESGHRKDDSGKTIPANHLTSALAHVGGKKLMEMHLGPSISKNPLISFEFSGKKGEKLRLSLADNQNKKYSTETTVK
jgi:sulfur-oxidizing protein SoxZ